MRDTKPLLTAHECAERSRPVLGHVHADACPPCKTASQWRGGCRLLVARQVLALIIISCSSLIGGTAQGPSWKAAGARWGQGEFWRGKLWWQVLIQFRLPMSGSRSGPKCGFQLAVHAHLLQHRLAICCLAEQIWKDRGATEHSCCPRLGSIERVQFESSGVWTVPGIDFVSGPANPGTETEVQRWRDETQAQAHTQVHIHIHKHKHKHEPGGKTQPPILVPSSVSRPCITWCTALTVSTQVVIAV